LKTLLKNYKSVYDFIIFGSFVKSKLSPKDIDIAMISSSSDSVFIGEIKQKIDKITDTAHLQIINYNDFLKSKLPYYILSEGYSVKLNRYIPDKLKINRKTLYSFELTNMNQSQKVMFNKALRSLVQTTKSQKVGKGAVLVDVKNSGEFEDLFNQWQSKIKKKEFLEI